MAHESSSDLNTSMIMVVGLVSAVATFVIILGLVAMFNSVRAAQERVAISDEYADPETVLNAQRQALRQPELIEASTGQVRIPIELAMTKVVANLRDNRGDAGIRSSQFVQSQATAAETMPAAADEGDDTTPGGEPVTEADEASNAPQAEVNGDTSNTRISDGQTAGEEAADAGDELPDGPEADGETDDDDSPAEAAEADLSEPEEASPALPSLNVAE